MAKRQCGEKVTCPNCGGSYTKIGLSRHLKSCKGRGISPESETKIKNAQDIKQIGNLGSNPKETNEFMDLALFSFMNAVNIPTYAQIQTFFTSFNIQTEKVAITVFRGLKNSTLCINEQLNGEYGTFLTFLLKWLPPGLINFQLPHSLSIQDAFSQFSGLGFKDIHQFVEFLKKIAFAHPDVLDFSSEKTGQAANILTIKNVFSGKILIARDGAWKVN